MRMTTKLILERWQITEQELTLIIDENPSLRGFMIGYIAEHKLRALLTSSGHVEKLEKPDDHDRREGNKSDLILTYRGHRFSFEVKSLQSNSIKPTVDGGYKGKTQVDASDRRLITLPNGDQVETTCLLCGEFDILAINLFQFTEGWDFAFALNRDLPKSTFRGYTEAQRQYLLATLVSVSWPLQNPFSMDPFTLLDILVEERQNEAT